MIVSLISSVLGMAGGLLPDIMKEFTASREHKREMTMMEKQAELQLKLLQGQTDAKLAEIDGNVYVEEMKAFGKQMAAIYQAQKPVGIPFVDGFNALIRPTTASLVMVMFVVTATMYIVAVLQQFGNGIIDLQAASTIIWGSLVGDAIQAVLGFLFGYRSTKGRLSPSLR